MYWLWSFFFIAIIQDYLLEIDLEKKIVLISIAEKFLSKVYKILITGKRTRVLLS